MPLGCVGALQECPDSVRNLLRASLIVAALGIGVGCSGSQDREPPTGERSQAQPSESTTAKFRIEAGLPWFCRIILIYRHDTGETERLAPCTATLEGCQGLGGPGSQFSDKGAYVQLHTPCEEVREAFCSLSKKGDQVVRSYAYQYGCAMDATTCEQFRRERGDLDKTTECFATTRPE